MRHVASPTAAPFARGRSRRRVDCWCIELVGAARASRLLPDGASSPTKPSSCPKACAAPMPPVILEGEPLEAVCQFDYLWCRFTSDGDDAANMRHRMAIAVERSHSLDYLWHDNRLARSLKLRLYAASVCSTLTHGSEAWTLTPRALATLNGFSSRQLHRITGRSYREEATRPSYDLPAAVRRRKQQWLGHILRMPPDRLVRCAVLAMGRRQGPPYQPGSLLMDATLPLDQLALHPPTTGKPLGSATLSTTLDYIATALSNETIINSEYYLPFTCALCTWVPGCIAGVRVCVCVPVVGRCMCANCARVQLIKILV